MSATIDRAAVRAQADLVLAALVGSADARLHADQWTAIDALVNDHRRALVVQRTGWGKSAVYFVATAVLRSAGAGPTILISPLLSLMRNQVAAAARAGIVAETINSANLPEWEQIYGKVRAGRVDVLLVSPERLNNPGFVEQVLPALAATAGLVVVDEAHCVSDWGHDFRPDYRRIRSLLARLPAGTPVLATTATANSRVSADVAEQLDDGTGTPVLVLRGPLERPSLRMSVTAPVDHAQSLAWLTTNLPALPGSGIIYTLTVSAAEQVAAHLRAAGLDVAAYTGRTDPTERELAEGDLLANRVKALVATSALGMGFDKPDLGFVVHVGAPPSPVAYYQQVGRAGRGTARAEVVLLPGREDKAIWDWFAGMSFPAAAQVRAVLDVLAQAGATMSVPALETRVDLRRGRLEMLLKVLNVDGAVERVAGGWRSTGTPWVYDEDRYARLAQARAAEQDLMVEYEALPGCRQAFLRAVLDDPVLRDDPTWGCGTCDRCTGTAAAPIPCGEVVRSARAALGKPGVPLASRRQWPAGMVNLGVDLTGRIPATEQAEEGLALARIDGLGLGGVMRELFGPRTGDGPVPPALRQPVLDALAGWGVHADAVVVVASTTRPALVGHLAGAVARTLGVPLIGAVEPGDERPGRHDVNSAQRLVAAHRRLHLALTAPALAELCGKSVVLVDDRSDSGWTLTVAARLLRLAGAGAVHPFVLAAGS